MILDGGFYCGYSPERINPGDKEHYLTDILKITSGSTNEVAKKVDDLYKSIIIAGTYLAQSIKVAEAAKITENTQRDVNIALVNDLAVLFDRLELDTHEVLKAAETKWNFLLILVILKKSKKATAGESLMESQQTQASLLKQELIKKL